MRLKKVIEPLAVKTQAITSASEVAEMILRIDDIIAGSSKNSGGGTVQHTIETAGHYAGLGGVSNMFQILNAAN